jgi:tetratricopeptide (TPR) repeat protein
MNSSVTVYRNYLFADGIRLWKDVVKKAPNSDRARCILATNLMTEYENTNKPELLKESEVEFKKAIELYPSNDTAHCNLSRLYYLKGEYKKSVEEAKITNSITTSVYAYSNMGSAYEKLGEDIDAKYAYLDGYKADPKFTPILRKLGDLYYRLEDFDNAKKMYTELLENSTSEEAIAKIRLEKMNSK